MLKHMPSGPATGQSRPTRGHPPNTNNNRSIQPLNVSTISHQITPNKIIANGHANGHAPRISTVLNTTPLTSCSSSNPNHCGSIDVDLKQRIGAREALTSLGLLCLGELYCLLQ